jgi:hypothetical protein
MPSNEPVMGSSLSIGIGNWLPESASFGNTAVGVAIGAAVAAGEGVGVGVGVRVGSGVGGTSGNSRMCSL